MKKIIRKVIDDFFGEDEFLVNSLDDEDRELLSTAISDAIEREAINENQAERR